MEAVIERSTENNIKIDLRERERENRDWIHAGLPALS
jgi:hypothetical protein